MEFVVSPSPPPCFSQQKDRKRVFKSRLDQDSMFKNIGSALLLIGLLLHFSHQQFLPVIRLTLCLVW